MQRSKIQQACADCNDVPASLNRIASVVVNPHCINYMALSHKVTLTMLLSQLLYIIPRPKCDVKHILIIENLHQQITIENMRINLRPCSVTPQQVQVKGICLKFLNYSQTCLEQPVKIQNNELNAGGHLIQVNLLYTCGCYDNQQQF